MSMELYSGYFERMVRRQQLFMMMIESIFYISFREVFNERRGGQKISRGENQERDALYTVMGERLTLCNANFNKGIGHFEGWEFPSYYFSLF